MVTIASGSILIMTPSVVMSMITGGDREADYEFYDAVDCPAREANHRVSDATSCREREAKIARTS